MARRHFSFPYVCRCCMLVACVRCIGVSQRTTVRRLLVLANRRLLCNCDSRTVIIITFGLSSAATSTREYACRHRRRRRRRRRRCPCCPAFERRPAKNNSFRFVRRSFREKLDVQETRRENSSGVYCIVVL